MRSDDVLGETFPQQKQLLQHAAVRFTDPSSICSVAKRGLTAQSYVLVLVPFQSLIDLFAAVVGPHFVQHKEIRIDGLDR